ncbi:hypothetical protein B7R21_16865 [Subtercola boreus]|uniref:Uncharacterized protein n=1 Tax=Subtercola boreus TaxID=120213 RepID=A0A3E0VC94_9MICO|nr:hypothetical protein B7R21_16865 [Subtercola boreus]
MQENTSLIVEDLLLLLPDDRSGNILGEGALMYPLGGVVLLSNLRQRRDCRDIGSHIEGLKPFSRSRTNNTRRPV